LALFLSAGFLTLPAIGAASFFTGILADSEVFLPDRIQRSGLWMLSGSDLRPVFSFSQGLS
jgi:hypothetical protein